MAYRILIVDDEPDLEHLMRQKFRRHLREGKLEFAFARNGEEALAALSGDPSIEVVLSDINMPVMDGLTLLVKLNELNRLLKAVMVSAYGDMQNIRTAMNRGAFDFVTKPIDFEDLEITINKTLDTVVELKQALKTREELTAIQRELSVAAEIQRSILPRSFPPFPERSEFEIFAAMTPAREVGGDFYDFFLIGEDRLGFVIGDVSGKGIPAAIFMAVSRTLLRATATQGLDAGECVQYVNRILASQGSGNMFVTIFYAILNTRAGDVEFCAGGHNPPYLFSAGQARALKSAGGPIVGILPKAEFRAEHLKLAPGEAILLYTDGVTEACDAAENEFTEQRLEAILREAGGKPLDELVGRIGGEVKTFCGDAPQSDDITMLAVRYLG
jgi:sigma-B regulation protein RsbU (phosphoserine phosphatase)